MKTKPEGRRLVVEAMCRNIERRRREADRARAESLANACPPRLAVRAQPGPYAEAASLAEHFGLEVLRVRQAHSAGRVRWVRREGLIHLATADVATIARATAPLSGRPREAQG